MKKVRHRNMPLALLVARERVITQFRPILKAHDITEQQWRIVRVLLEIPALEPREISELCCISGPSLTGVLSRMQELGFVNRRLLKNDQRRFHVILTARGRALAERMAPQIDATYERIEAIVGVELCNDLYSLLDRLLLALKPEGAAGARPLPVSPAVRALLRQSQS